MTRDLELRGPTVIVARPEPDGQGFLTTATVGVNVLRADAPLLASIARAITGQPVADDELDALVAAGVLGPRRASSAGSVSAAAGGLHPYAEEAVERLALDPRVAITPVQPSVDGPDGPVHPEGALPISMYVPPAALGPAQALAGVLRRAWRQILAAAQARDQLVDRARAREILAGIAREELDASPALAAAFAIDPDDGRLVPRAPLQVAREHYPIAALSLSLDRETPELLATGGAAIDVAIGPGELAEIGHLLGLLHAGSGPAELGPVLARSAAARRFFGDVVALGLASPAPARRALAGQVPPGTVVHLGHATLLANVGGAHVLIDPWLPPASSRDRVPPPHAADLPPLAAILFTHHHWDHVHAESLLGLDKRVPVYLPAQPADRPLVPRTERLLAYLGFGDVRPLRWGSAIALGDGGGVVAVPFTGEDPCATGFAGNCYVLVHDGKAALVHVDASPDRDGRSLVASGDAADLARAFGPLSPVFCTRRQERGTMIEHGWEALLRPSREWVAPTENCATGAAFLAEFARATRTTCLALYSEGGADWYPAFTNFIAPPRFAAHAAPYQYGWDSLDQIRAAAPAAVELSAPYDRFRIGAGRDGAATPRSRSDHY